MNSILFVSLNRETIDIYVYFVMAGLSTYLDIFYIMRNFGDLKNFNHLFEVIISKIPYELSEEDRSRLKDFSRRVTINITKKWTESNRTLKTFLNRENNRTWLESDIQWPTCDTVDLNILFGDCADVDEETPGNFSSSIVEQVPSTSTADASTSTEKITRVPFQDLGNKQKKRRSDPMINEKTEEELFYCYTQKLKANGKADFAKIVEHLAKYPDTIPSVSEFLFMKKKTEIPEDKSLAALTSLNLSKWQYLTLRGLLKEENSANLPSYKKIMESKKRCYPPDESIEVTEGGASIRLQALLDHTVQRILLDLGPITSDQPLKLLWKWGLDGSSSQSNYKQKSCDPDLKDASVVMISAVPLRLINEEGTNVWENPTPSSPQYCRPLKFTFTTETAEFIQTEHSRMQQEISELLPTKCDLVEIVHELHMTMIDGKIANTVAGVSSSATCPICLAKPSEMNNLDLLATKPVRENLYQYGISSLHMRIRCMECLLHVSYNQDFERWTARGEHKELKKAKKSLVQKEFREEAGILIDIVKQGFGTTNDGNTARHFFLDYKRSARITGIDENLIFRFSVILQAVCSGKKINLEAFKIYSRETAEMFVHLYPWYYMPVSVHKLLMHGADICSHFSVLPIGLLSEEASEARNKDFRNIRKSHARKSGRVATNEDILHGLLVSSDPHISRIRPKFSKPSHQDLFPEAAELLILEETDLIDESFEEEESLLMESENISDPLA